jgi:hypothetical protein
MTFVEQLLPLRWGANLRVQRVMDHLFVTGMVMSQPDQRGQCEDLWERYLASPTNWSTDCPSPHIEFANADTDDKLIDFVKRFGPVVVASYEDDASRLAACQEMNELRDEQALYSAALRLLSELQRDDKPNHGRIIDCARKIVDKARAWPGQWKRELEQRTSVHLIPPWIFHQVTSDRIENHLASVEAAIARPTPATPLEAALWQFVCPADTLSLAQSLLCELINAFPAKIQPVGHKTATEWPDPDLSYGIRPLLYLILRRTWLKGSIGICANERCRNLFEVDRKPYCSDECSRKERQRQYWTKDGSARRRKRKRALNRDAQKTRTKPNLMTEQRSPRRKRSTIA